jgi:archaellum biogenesis ATPase FlaH
MKQKLLPLDWKTYDGPDKIVGSHEMELLLADRPRALLEVKCNMPSLDRYCDGFRSGELIVISGPTKNGKTLLAQTLTYQFTKQQQFPLWFSYEVPTMQFLGQFTDLPLFFLPKTMKAHAFDWLEDRVAEAHARYNTRIIFIDHLHYLFDLARTRNPSIDIGNVVRRLKSMAVNNEYLIFLLCHTTKGKHEETLSYESIRDSSFVSQESDCVILVRRTPQVAHNAAEILVEFHRRTGTMEVMLPVRKLDGYLVETIPERCNV